MTCARREAGARTPAPSTSARSPRKPDARTGRARARLFGLLPALALLLGALGLFTPEAAQAQTTVWSATLTVDRVEDSGSVYMGCDDTYADQDNCSSALSDNDFIYEGTTYVVRAFYAVDNPTTADKIVFILDKDIPDALRTGAILHYGSSEEPFKDAVRDPSAPSNKKRLFFPGTHNWADDASIALKIVLPASTDATLSALTVTKSASNNVGHTGLTLSPATFDADTEAYTASVGPGVRYVRVTPTVNKSGATVKVGTPGNLHTVASGTASHAIELTAIENVIQVVVTDGSTTKTYTVTVTNPPTLAFTSGGSGTINEVATSQLGNSVTVTVNIAPPLAQASTVKVNIRDTLAFARVNEDFTVSGLTAAGTALGQTVWELALQAGASSASFTVTAVADNTTDGRLENVEITLEAISSAPYDLGDPSKTAILIVDNSLDPVQGECTVSTSPPIPAATIGQGAGVPVKLTTEPAGAGGMRVTLALPAPAGGLRRAGRSCAGGPHRAP